MESHLSRYTQNGGSIIQQCSGETRSARPVDSPENCDDGCYPKLKSPFQIIQWTVADQRWWDPTTSG